MSMTFQRLKVLNDWLAVAQSRMGLTDWHINIRMASSQELIEEQGDWQAIFRCAVYRCRATIIITDAFFALTEEDQRQCLVHELIHAHLEPAWLFAQEMTFRMAPEIGELSRETYKRLIEPGIDNLASAMAAWVPVIPWVEFFAEQQAKVKAAVDAPH